jgi:polyhydroxyalkanoate synthase subunit PhaE
MTNGGDSHTANPVSAAYIKACEDYLGVHQAIVEQFNNRTAPTAVFGVPPAFLDAWKSLAQSMGAPVGVPALGPAREHLEVVQKMTDLGLQFQHKYAEFTAHLADIPQDAMRGIRELGAGTTYDEWIESAEAAYASLAHGATFARLLGELCNKLNALKVQRGKLLEYFSRQLDLPTRAEVDSLHQQVRLLREQSREKSREKSRQKSGGRSRGKGGGK